MASPLALCSGWEMALGQMMPDYDPRLPCNDHALHAPVNAGEAQGYVFPASETAARMRPAAGLAYFCFS